MPYDNIPDPLKAFEPEHYAETAGVRDPKTGIRQSVSDTEKTHLKDEEIKRKAAMTRRVIQMLTQDELGREWLYDILATCNIFGSPFNLDPTLTAYNSGALFIGRLIESDIKKHAARNYLLLCQEGWEREQLWNADVADK